MPIAKEIQTILENTDRTEPKEDYFEILPTLDPEEFPDEASVRVLGGEKVHKLLIENGLTKAQRCGVTRIANIVWLVKAEKNRLYHLTLGDIRGLSFGEFLQLREHFAEGKPSERSFRVLKRLCG